MADNPLFPPDNRHDKQSSDEWRAPAPIPGPRPQSSNGANPAADLVRQKLARIYAEEPNARDELKEAEIVRPRSKHQQFMHELSMSGKSLAEIQSAWHDYYTGLPDKEKHEVWQEFYDATANLSSRYHPAGKEKKVNEPTHTKQAPNEKTKDAGPDSIVGHFEPRELPAERRARAIDRRSTAEISKAIRNKVSTGGKLKVKHHIQSLLFGLGLGSLVIFIFLFGFFNEFFIAPFLQPGRNTGATPIILDPTGKAPGTGPEVIIPKISVELPVVYSETSTDNSVIESALEDGVVHYPTTSMPGQKGNAVFFGHSAVNVFTPGHYKYAFGLLHLIKTGDTFYLIENKKVYVYTVVSRQVVPPTDVGVLNPVAGYTATATLITCDPPGLSINRLVVVGQQISPDPSKNTTAVTASAPASSATALPGNGPSLWGYLTRSFGGKAIIAAGFAAGVLVLAFSVRLVAKNS